MNRGMEGGTKASRHRTTMTAWTATLALWIAVAHTGTAAAAED